MTLRALSVAVIVTLASCASRHPGVFAAEVDGAGPPVTVTHPVAFEAPYKLGQRPSLRSPSAALAEQAELARWNEGGRTGPWHPAVRIGVDDPRVSGSISANTVLTVARRDGYWPIRRCFEEGLADNPELGGKVRVRFTLRNSGTAVRPTFEGDPELQNREVADCVRRCFRSIRFPRTRKDDATVTLTVAMYPGDAPVRRSEAPPVTAGPGTLEMPVVHALVAAQAGAQAQRCYLDGVSRMPGLWGRLVLRADVGATGALRNVVEFESTFPDPGTTKCVQDAVSRVALPPPQGGDLRVVIPIRFGPPAVDVPSTSVDPV
ncbi:MAG: AgmX/PglI C-terminal domain-containing protein [Polyangiaceae bacterium]|jgi:hypothetical protein|nr:AgmX/PglI C-terminal domain-containing protein [Polyangiaceae bacterium]